MNRGKELIKNTLIIAIGQLLPQLTNIIIIPIITGCLTQKEYGEYDLISVLVALMLPLITLQLEQAAFRYLIDCREDKERSSIVVTNVLCFIIGVAFVGLVILFLSLKVLPFNRRVLVSVYLFSNILLTTMQQIARGLSFNKIYSYSAVIQATLKMILVCIVVYFLGRGLDGLLIVLIVSSAIGCSVLLYRIRIIDMIRLKYLDWKIIKEMLSYSWPMVPNTLSAWVLSASDRILITFFCGVEMNAIYAAANKIPQLFSVAQGTFIFAWQENAAVTLKDEDVEEYYSGVFNKVFRLLVGVLAVLIGATPLLFTCLIRGNYGAAYFQMPILFMGMFFYSLSSFIGGIYIAHKKTLNVGVSTVFAALVNFFINICFIKQIGIYAASFSTLISYMILWIYRIKNVQQFQKIRFKIKELVICISLLSIMCVLCWMQTWYFDVFNLILSVVLMIGLNKDILVQALQRFMKKKE